MTKDRIGFLDTIRVFAIVFVLMCHVPMIYNINMMDADVNVWWKLDMVRGIIEYDFWSIPMSYDDNICINEAL